MQSVFLFRSFINVYSCAITACEATVFPLCRMNFLRLTVSPLCVICPRGGRHLNGPGHLVELSEVKFLDLLKTKNRSRMFALIKNES